MSAPDIEPPTKTEAILTAATELFTQFGYRRTSMDDIAHAAQMAKGTLYLYFDGKAAVFRAMQARNLAQAEAQCDAREAMGGTLADRLYGVLDALYGGPHERYGRSEHLTELVNTRLTVGPDLARQVDETYTRRICAVLTAALDSGAAVMPPGLDADSVTQTLMSAARGAKAHEAGPVSPDDYRAALRRLADLTAAALRP